jgi:hypothetical protein
MKATPRRWLIARALAGIFVVCAPASAHAYYQTRGAYNPATGRGVDVSRGYNPATGTMGRSVTGYNSYTGSSATRSRAYNPYTGRSATSGSAYNGWNGHAGGYAYTTRW